MSIIKKDWFLWLLVAATFVIGLLVYPKLPEQVPMHWNVHGEIDGYGSRLVGAFALPLMNLAFLLMFRYLPKLDPRRENYPKFSGAYRAFQWVLIMFFVVLYLVIIGSGLGYELNVGLIVKLGIGIIFLVIGNYLGKIRHNYFVGIRNPWTLASEEVWLKTHRVTGPLFMLVGLLLIILAFNDSPLSFWITIGGIFAVVIVSTVYSYLIYKKRQV